MTDKNLLYDLYKMAFALNREQKENLSAHMRPALKEASKREMVKTAAGSHDPETVKEMENLIRSLKKYIDIDGDLNYGNIGVFINPMSVAAKKIAFRPYKLIGTVKNLFRLSRDYKKARLSKNKRGLREIRKDFNKNLDKITIRLKHIKKVKKRTALRVDSIRKNVDNSNKTADRFISNMENMMKTSSLSINEVVDIVSSDVFYCEGKDLIVKELKKNIGEERNS